MKGKDIREKFLKYFEKNGHKKYPSASLIPEDPTVLLTLAGMLPFKPIFLGQKEPEDRRVTSVQKCIRMNDIENVGRTARHQTFFEMLGNFSFGYYFKKEAMYYAQELLTKVFNLPKDRLLYAVYEKDDEAFELWNKTLDIPSNKIFRLGEDNNFWSVGPTGPCGPCSEIYYDLGEEFGCKNPNCAPGCDCDRFLELWNLVFIEFNRDEFGKLNPLPSKNIDTGMGLERIASVLQGVPSNFDTDLIKPIIDEAVKLSGHEKQLLSLRIVADHARAVTHLIADGVVPGNEGRNYVLRRLIRRAVRHGRLLGINEPFLSRLAKVVINIGKDAYPEMAIRANHISKVITLEEQGFLETLEKGIKVFRDLVLHYHDQKVIPGEELFKLHDTYGFPIDLSAEIAMEEGLEIDRAGFEKCMEEQRERARSGGKESGSIKAQIQFLDLAKLKPTKFVGYNKLVDDAKVVKVFKEENAVVLDKTPFYPESGGQVADSGLIIAKDHEILVLRAFGKIGSPIVHQVDDIDDLKAGDKVKVQIDSSKRGYTAAHHTATHLLHSALRKVLGPDVKQAGSLVAPDRLRFDFTYMQALTPQQIAEVENFVNEVVRNNTEVNMIETSIEEAKRMGAMALFSEKYDKKVRVIKVGDVSMELCGGTHVNSIRDVGFFKIISEGAIASGIRRIEAVAGRAAKLYVMMQAKKMKDQVGKLIHEYKMLQVQKARLGLKQSMDTGIFEIDQGEMDSLGKAMDQIDPASVKKFLDHLRGRVEWLEDRNENVRKEISRKKKESALGLLPKLISSAEDVNGTKLIISSFEDLDMETLRQFSDQLKKEMPSHIILLSSVQGSRVSFLGVVSQDMITKGIPAPELVNVAAKLCGGRGGGRRDRAEAGGNEPAKIKDGLEAARKFVKGKLS
ncbi:MAG: alanine--tRNA ligase [Candidatus Margulisbacteria bacterium]|nr:alanine--tRNA ligase [Candidatus Margulisiibacteriota bacterium]MBU1022602.1 alanine--tRNA ligase [Candidatus Margulisiibacteriota bacterium]MBU1728888.1 alanine--tRNA ligase [Candidatus Margulisiibacteriota bacterium]